MEIKQNPPVGLPTFNDMSRYGTQEITPYTLPDITSDGGGTSVADNSFDFPSPDADSQTTSKPKDKLDKVQSIKQQKRRNRKAEKSAKRWNKRNPNDKIPADDSFETIATPSYDAMMVKLKNLQDKNNSPTPMMGQQYDQQSPQGTVPMQNLMPDQTAMSYQPPMPGNVQGTAKPLFNPSVTNAAQQIYGSEEQRQQSVPGAPLYFTKENALKAGKKKIQGKPYGTTIRHDKNYGGAPLRMHHYKTGNLVTYDKFVSDQGKLHMGSESPYAGITNSEISKNTFPHKKSEQYIKDSIVGKINSGKPLTNLLDHKMIGNYRMGYGGKPSNSNDIRRIKQLKK